MTTKFDGKKIRDRVVNDLKNKIADLGFPPVLTVIWVGADPISARYISQKQRTAEELGIHFDIEKFSSDASETEIANKILQLGSNQRVTGIMIQLPLPKNFDRRALIAKIDPAKDVDGLHFCSNLKHLFLPPVILAILEALKISGANLKSDKLAVIGRGFLVGGPLIRILRERVSDLRIADDKVSDLKVITLDADVIISATGVAKLIKSDMIKKGAILIDAGSAEIGGQIVGDIDSKAYEKSAFYTPVPGGIGPLTVAALFENLYKAAESQKR